MKIGIISDTHGLVRPEVANAFKGVKLILHAGDIGSAEVLRELESLARVVAVRGNNDRDEWASSIPETITTEVSAVSIYMLHDLNELDLKPSAAGVNVVISGHSHKPQIETRDGVLFVNPGSAGPRRFKLPVSVALMTIKGPTVRAEILDLISIAGRTRRAFSCGRR